jgi:hypothetical protein
LKGTVNGGGGECQTGRNSCHRALAVTALVWASIAAPACSPGARTGSETLREFYRAAQEQDVDRLYCLLAGASEAAELGASENERRAGFESWARAYYEAYETGRDAGRVELDEQGLVLVKLFSLGRGTFVSQGAIRASGPDTLVVETRVRFGYAHIDLSPFSPGTTFYVCGAPIGRVYPLRVPVGSREVSVDALEEVMVAWTLVRSPAAGGCPARWKVAAGEPVEGSATTREVTWVF